MSFFIYILESSKDKKLYIGQTNCIENRLLRHNNGEVTATKNRRPLTLLHKEEYNTSSESTRRERYLKSLKSSVYLRKNIIKQY
ncbi:GIY-YIG nuclease family protein [Patescibacteria group bacterium]